MPVVLVRGLYASSTLDHGNWRVPTPPHPNATPGNTTLDHNKASYLIGGKVAWKPTRRCNKKNELPNQQRSFRIFPSDLPPKTKQKHKVGVLVLNDRTRFIYTPQLGNIWKKSMWYIICFSTNHRKKRSIHRNRRLVGGFNSIEKNGRQIGSSPQVNRGENSKKIFELPAT